MKRIIAFLVVSVLINVILLSIFRGFVGMDIACVLAIFLYLFLTYVVFRNLTDINIFSKLVILLSGTLIVHVPLRVVNFNSQLVSLPELICELLGISLGFIFFYVKTTGKILTLFTAILLSTTIYINYDKVLDVLNYSNFFYKHTELINIDAVPYFDMNHVCVNHQLFDSDKYILLNIWATTCGLCITEFPQIDSLYALSKTSNNIQLYTACILQKENMKTPFKLVSERNFSFPVFTIPNWDFVSKEYGMDAVPVTFVIKNKEAIFRGSLLNAWKTLQCESKK